MLLSVAHRSATHALRAAKAVTRTYAAAAHAVSSDGTRIAYTATAGGGTPTLLINGWAGCAADWGSLVDRLGASGRRVVAFDPRGFGASGDGAAASVRTRTRSFGDISTLTMRTQTELERKVSEPAPPRRRSW